MITIELCKTCNGHGHIQELDEKNFTHKIICKTCNGSGRTILAQWQITLPFDFNENTIYEADKKIHNIIQELNNSKKTKILFMISKGDTPETITFNYRPTQKEVDLSFDEICGGVYKWWYYND